MINKKVKIDTPEDNPKKDKKDETLKEKLEQALEEVTTWKNKYYMVFADMENTKKQNEKTLANALKYRAEGFIMSLFPVLDSFQSALQMTSDDPKLNNYLVGFSHIYKQLQQVLTSEGLEDISPNIGDQFDYQSMHALDTEVSEAPLNSVTKIIARGYKLKDKIIRPAFVILAKAKEEPAIEETQEVLNPQPEEENKNN